MMNDETNQFESRLSRQPLRQIPPTWRAEILAAARTAQATPHESRVTHHSWLSTINHQLSTLFWPHPKAWAGLAAAWVLILGLNVSTRDDSGSRVTAKTAPPSPEMMVELRKQQRMFAELVGSREERVADRSKSYAPRPRTQREEMATV
jgi:hypothetical protein